MKNYQCKKCRTHLQKASRPSTSNCPSGGVHNWTDLGNVGSDNYQCKKCSLLVKSKSRPSTSNCTSGGVHNWSKL